MISSKQLKHSQIVAVLALLAALLSMSAATFAWYIFHTSAQTTEVKMSAGTSVSLQISTERDGTYASAAVMEDFHGILNPVSTDKLSAGFQRAENFRWMDNPDTEGGRLFAALFHPGEESVDYHKTSLFLRTNNKALDIYLSDIGYEDADSLHPISTALRLGLVIKQPDEAGNYPEYIFALNSQPDENRGDNAARQPEDNQALDSSKTDGTTVTLVPLNRDNFCAYNPATGEATRMPESRKLFTLTGSGMEEYGQPVEVEVYLWLEGCDLDCTPNLSGQTLKKLSVSFAGIQSEGG